MTEVAIELTNGDVISNFDDTCFIHVREGSLEWHLERMLENVRKAMLDSTESGEVLL